MTFFKSIKYLSCCIGLLLISNQTMAQTISWSLLNASAVPLSHTTMIILALTLFVIATYFIKSKRTIKNSLFIVTVITGVIFIGSNIVDNKAFALIVGLIVNINSPSGTEHLAENETTQVTNNYASPIRITAVNPENCSITLNTCTVGAVLNTGKSCEVTTVCCPSGTEPRNGGCISSGE